MLSVPASVSELDAVSVLPSAIVSVEPVAGAVMATLLILVAAATPSVGVTSVGDVASTMPPDPVTFCPSAVVTPVPNAVGSVKLVAPVVVNVSELAPEVASVEPSASVKVADVAGAVIATLFTLVAEATPSVGVTKVGDVANTKAPEPVIPVEALSPAAIVSPIVLLAPNRVPMICTAGVPALSL